ncbi:MAG: TonB-dependent receptor [Brevundimonas subvibrioides]|uniref:TonB-dependent receptor n=1 Tax=Brevundimonas subvibrioides TaxID=74313 RepID=A0A258HIN0_9CAUL|nr:TonB-dependent receptor [Brevundimonas subvibrioides]OYX56766.1 MAG: TonB-dependent receptor [Brevundimonas subvibrioides]
MTTHRLLAGVSTLALALTGALVLPTAVQAQAVVSEPGDAAQLDEVVVFGVGQSRQQASITEAAIAVEAPGTSPLKAIERLPGVSFQSADAFGNYEWSARIVLRSFNQNQLGFTLDGVPLGDMSYGNHNGLHISRAIISENVGRVDVAQGSGALGTASSSNLGGTVQFISRRPADEFGLDVAATYGSEQTLRGLIRLDTGAFGPAGTALSLSYVDHQMDKWKGVGEQNQQQINASLVQPIGKGEITGFVNWSERRENDYQDLSLAQIGYLGRDFDNISGNYALAVRIADIANNRGETGAAVTNVAAGTVYPAPIRTVDDAYFDASGLRDDTIGALTFNYPISDAFSVSLTGYGHRNEGQGLWWTPYVATPVGAPDQNGTAITAPSPISVRTTEYDIERTGALGSAMLDLGTHSIEAGFWLEKNDFNQARRFYGLARAANTRSSLEFLENPFFTQWEYEFETETRLFYVQDSWAVTDALTVFGGFKSLSVENTARTVTGPNKTGTIKAEDNFLPQVGATFDVNDDHQIFVSYSENLRAFESSNTGGPFSASAAGFAALRTTIEPESSRTAEAGWRFRYDQLQGSVAVYNVEFSDRLLGVALGAPILGLGSGIQNVGSVKSRGFEAAAVWSFNDDWSAFGSFSYNDSTYEDDVRDGTGALVAATGGKTVVNTPETLFRAELAYDDGALFGTLAAAYTGERFSSYLNDESVDGYTLVELTGGYRIADTGGWLDGTELQLNVTNLLDEDHISTVGSGGFQNTAGRQTFLPGAPRQVFVSVRRHF